MGWCTNGVLNTSNKTAKRSSIDQCALKVEDRLVEVDSPLETHFQPAKSGSATTASASLHAGHCISIHSMHFRFPRNWQFRKPVPRTLILGDSVNKGCVLPLAVLRHSLLPEKKIKRDVD